MSFFKKLFGGPRLWIVRSLDQLQETRAIPVTNLPWSGGTPSDLAVGVGVAPRF
jgi:hypothetical protein